MRIVYVLFIGLLLFQVTKFRNQQRGCHLALKRALSAQTLLDQDQRMNLIRCVCGDQQSFCEPERNEAE